MARPEKEAIEKMRIDKWLWTARFFKTRKLAAEAVAGGKVHIDGNRSKASKDVSIGTELSIHKDELEWNITIQVLSKQRRPASEASQFYTEEPKSLDARQEKVRHVRAMRAANPIMPSSKPNKKDRRLIHKFKSNEQ